MTDFGPLSRRRGFIWAPRQKLAISNEIGEQTCANREVPEPKLSRPEPKLSQPEQKQRRSHELECKDSGGITLVI